MTTTTELPPSQKLLFLSVDRCRVSARNTRADLGDDFPDFCASVATHGILQPVLAQPLTGDDADFADWEIIAGKRRYSAAVKTGLLQIPALVQERVDDVGVTCAMLLENLQRRNFDALEEAHGFRWLADSGMSLRVIAASIDSSYQLVQRRLSLLGLPKETQALVRAKTLGVSDAEKRARAYAWLDKKRERQAAGESQIIEVHSPESGARFFDSTTGAVHWSVPCLSLDERPCAGELLRSANRRNTWRDWIAGSEAGDSVKIICCVDRKWKPVELADAADVKSYIRANIPGVLRAADTNLDHAEREIVGYEHIVSELIASTVLGPIAAAADSIPPEILSLAAVCALERSDLEHLAARLGGDDLPTRDIGDYQQPAAGTLRAIVLERSAPHGPLALLLSGLLLISARRDSVRLSDHPAALPLLDHLDLNPGALTHASVTKVAHAIRRRKSRAPEKNGNTAAA